MTEKEFERQKQAAMEEESKWIAVPGPVEKRIFSEGAAAERAAVRVKLRQELHRFSQHAVVGGVIECLISWLDARAAQDQEKPSQAGDVTGAYWGGRSYSRGELERAVAAAEKDVLARHRGRLVAFLESGRPVILADVPPGELRVETTSFEPGSLPDLRQGERIVQVGFRAPAPISPERAKGREEGLELARRAASETMAFWHPDLLKQVVESINKAAEAAKEER